MSQVKELQNNILRSISRSFFLSLKVLPANIRPTVSLGYLLCRAADSIADAADHPLAERLKYLQEFERIFTAFPPPINELRSFVTDMKDAGFLANKREGRLLDSLEDCTTLFRNLTRTDQTLVQDVVAAVIQGMKIDLNTFGENAETVQALKSSQDFERYIHWIGGEPGRFWTKTCLAHYPQMPLINRETWTAQGILFGTGLQIVNILRDLPRDLKDGRCYIPLDIMGEHGLTPSDLLEDTKTDIFTVIYVDLIERALLRLENGISYIEQLPWHAVRLKAAVWWPLIFGVRTLERLRRTPFSVNTREPVKITRWEVYGMMLKSLFCLPFNRLLKREFRKETGWA